MQQMRYPSLIDMMPLSQQDGSTSFDIFVDVGIVMICQSVPQQMSIIQPVCKSLFRPQKLCQDLREVLQFLGLLDHPALQEYFTPSRKPYRIQRRQMLQEQVYIFSANISSTNRILSPTFPIYHDAQISNRGHTASWCR